MGDALMNEAAWMTTRLKPCSLKVRAVCHSRVQSASSPLRKRSSFGRHHRQTSMIMRHQGTFATEIGQRAGAFHKKTLDPKIAFPIGMAKRHYQRGFLSIHRASSTEALNFGVTRRSSNARSTITSRIHSARNLRTREVKALLVGCVM